MARRTVTGLPASLQQPPRDYRCFHQIEGEQAAQPLRDRNRISKVPENSSSGGGPQSCRQPPSACFACVSCLPGSHRKRIPSYGPRSVYTLGACHHTAYNALALPPSQNIRRRDSDTKVGARYFCLLPSAASTRILSHARPSALLCWTLGTV